MNQVQQLLQRFKADERGVVSIELLLVTPILVWALLSTFVYFDLFRTESNINRAALTVADMFSREQTPITNDYLDGAQGLLETLTFSDENPDFRLTVYQYWKDDDAYRVLWSEHRGMGPALDDDNMEDLNDANRLPILADKDVSILLETRTEYSAPFSIGLGPFTATDLDDVTFTTFTVIRPRFSPSLCWESLAC